MTPACGRVCAALHNLVLREGPRNSAIRRAGSLERWCRPKLGRNRQTEPCSTEPRKASRTEVEPERPDDSQAAQRKTRRAPAGRSVASGLAVLRPPELFEPHPAHHLPQRHRPAGARDRHSLPLAIPRRPDRCARTERLLVQGEIIAGAIASSATAEQDTITFDLERLLELQAGESYGPSEETLSGIEFSINPERVATGAAPPGVADQYPRAHLRPRRRADPRQPQSLRRAALRSAAALGRQAGAAAALLCHDPHLVQPRHPAALSRARAAERQGLRRGGERAAGASSRAWSASTSAAR